MTPTKPPELFATQKTLSTWTPVIVPRRLLKENVTQLIGQLVALPASLTLSNEAHSTMVENSK
ncbi:hypothetical protein [Neomicrococcus lactis]|uniref:hypothetical protein n=1 Tax=Neomicrococcus lactis TaxID=732241 RepID=UPI00230067B3|nr:hypothetical protein [Neomicrococcus lactis]